MKIKGKKLAWAILFLYSFIGLTWADWGETNTQGVIVLFMAIVFFAWRFIENMGEAFN